MSPRGLAHPLLVRLFAVVLAVAGAAGVTTRAPQAFRAWTDTAADVSGTGRARPLERSAPGRVAPAPVQRTRVAIAPASPATLPSVRPAPGHGWPSAGTLRQLLAFKQSRLI